MTLYNNFCVASTLSPKIDLISTNSYKLYIVALFVKVLIDFSFYFGTTLEDVTGSTQLSKINFYLYSIMEQEEEEYKKQQCSDV
jgi:hypothetical protein